MKVAKIMWKNKLNN